MKSNPILLDKFNKDVRNTIDRFYLTRNADSFFTLCDMVNFCKEQGLTQEEVPALIEMTNIIVMG